MQFRTLGIWTGALLIASGLAILAFPDRVLGHLVALGIETTMAEAGRDLLAVLAIVLLLLVGLVILFKGTDEADEFDVDPMERAAVDRLDARGSHVAGTMFDESLAAYEPTGSDIQADQDDLESVRDRLRRATIAALQSTGYARAEATDAVRRGTWTDDPYAAAFLAEDATLDVLDRLREWASSESRFHFRVRHTTAAIDRVLAAESWSGSE